MNVYTYTAPPHSKSSSYVSGKNVPKISYASAGASISDNLHEAPAIGTAMTSITKVT